MPKKASVKPEATTAVQTAAAAAPAPAKKTRTPRAKSASGELRPKQARETAPRVSSQDIAVHAIAASTVVVDRQEVARLAYSYWEARGYQGGSPLDDWVRAENELREQTLAL